MTEDRNLNHEKRINAYLFKGGFYRFYEICKNIGITANINAIKNQLEEDKDNAKCEVCYKYKDSVRFEGLTESNICDSCLFEYKQKEVLK